MKRGEGCTFKGEKGGGQFHTPRKRKKEGAIFTLLGESPVRREKEACRDRIDPKKVQTASPGKISGALVGGKGPSPS